MATKEQDITKVGPRNWRQLQEENRKALNTPSFIDLIPSSRRYGATDFVYEGPEQSPILQQGRGDYLGNSAFDPEGNIDEEQWRSMQENPNELRAEEQPWIAQIGTGLAKGVVLAATTFLDGTAGLVAGVGTSIAEGRLSGLWDNEFSRAMKAVNEWSEEVMPNYYTQEEQEAPWYSNIFTANFIGDKFLKNIGFSVGALYSGGIYSKGISGLSKMIGLVANSAKAPAIINTAVGATMSALNEGRIEALNNSTDWYNTQKAQLDDYYRNILTGIQGEYEATKGKSLISSPDGSTYTDPAYVQYNKALEEANINYQVALAKLNEDRAKMGNVDMMLNLPILMFSNIAQFAKFYANGFKTARKSLKITGRAGEYAANKSALAGKWAVTKGALSEGLEEISQGAASRVAGDYYQDDVQNFYKARFNPEAEQETVNWMKSFAQGINETVNDGSAWEEFFIGTLTGLLGIPSFKRKANGKLGFGIEGGAYNEYQNYKEEMLREQEIADRLNERVKSPDFVNYYQSLIRHNRYQNQMNDAADRGDEFDYKNAEHAQFISDIAMFDNAGKLGDLKALINESFDTSDDNLDAIIRNTTAIQGEQLVGPYAQYAQLENGKIISNFSSEKDKQEMIDKLTKSKDEMLNSIEDYVKIKDDIDIRTKGILSDSQLEELTWMKSQIHNWLKRAEDVSGEVKNAVGNVIGNIEQVRAFNARIRDLEGQAHANLTETYKKADKQVQDLDMVLKNLDTVRNMNPASLALVLSSDEKWTNALIDEIKALPEDVMGEETKSDVVSKLNDIVRLGKATETYQAKLKEYTDNPEAQIKDQEKAGKQVAKHIQNEAKNAIAQRFDWNKSLGEIADTLDKNLEDIEKSGGLAEFIKSLTPEQREKLQKARSYKKGVDGLKGLVDESDMSDMQKRIADQLIDEESKKAESIEALGSNLRDALDKGVIGERITKALNSKEGVGVNDLAVEEAIENAEAKLREFLDDGISKAAAAANEAERISKAKTDKDLSDEAAEATSKLDEKEDKEKQDKIKKSLKGPQEKELNAPKEPKELSNKSIPKDDKSEELKAPKEQETETKNPVTTSKMVRDTNKSTNEKIDKDSGPIQAGSNTQKYSSRPQLSQVYMHGYDMQTYYQYINEHPEDIPEGVDKAAYLRYINAVFNYLKTWGAFQYVSRELKVGDEIQFVIDEELNKKAGTTVILLKSKGYIVGSLPTEIDLGSKTKYTITVDGKSIRKTKEKTVAQERPGIKALHDKIIKEYKDWKKTSKEGESSFSSKEVTKVNSLRGGILPLSNTESIVSDIFEGTGTTPIIAVADENGSPSRFQGKELDTPLMDPETAVQGQVYIMIPANTGKMLPALAYSLPLSQLLGPGDWYIRQIIEKIKSIPKNIRELSSASHDLYKLFRIPGLSVQIGKQAEGSWTNSTDITEATHLRLSYSDSENSEKAKVTSIPMTNGEMTDEDIWSAISGIIKVYPEVTTSVDITRLGNSEAEVEYRERISGYLKTNLIKGQAHAVNDWFTYEPTTEEKSASVKEKLDTLKEPLPQGKEAKVTGTVNLDGADIPENVEVKLEALDLGDDGSKNKELGNPVFFARGDVKSGGDSTFSIKVRPKNRFRGGKRLETSKTEDSSAERSRTAKDIRSLRKMFPNLSQAHSIVLVKGLINTVNEKGDPVKAYGEFRDGVLYISDQSPAGTAFHEAFHYITDMLMTQREKDNMFEAARLKYGNLSQLELEEKLAEDFRDFMNGYQGISGMIRRLFFKLKQIVNAISGRTNYLDNLFYSIYNNEFSKRVPQEPSSDSKLSEVNRGEAEEDFAIELLRYKAQKLSYDNLDTETKEYLELKKVSKEDYDNLSVEAKEDTLQCML